jgi:N-acyl homoserine lactone hydrolase
MKKLTFILVLMFTSTAMAQQRSAAAPTSVRLYILDCGIIVAMNPASYDLKPEEIKGPLDFITPCYLVVHPKGTLMWDVGQIADANMPASGPGSQGPFRVSQKLLPQLAALGYKPQGITFMAMSHYHGDHSANANEFAGSTWIVQESERAAMFAEPAPRLVTTAQYSKLRDAKTIVVKNTDHDVFGDGTVVIKYAPGHTPGHQMLFLRLANTGPVLLAGDLYHYPEERSLDRVPTFEFDRNQTRETRKKVETFLKETRAQFWIQHDMALHEKLKRAPQYID